MAFPPTRHSVLEAMRSGDAATRSRALGAVASGYWAPVCAYVSARWKVEPADAEDLTQSFFARALLGRVLERYDPARARFRTYLRRCLDRHVINALAARRPLEPLSGLEQVPADADAMFEREWVRGLLDGALDTMRRRLNERGRGIVYRVFVRYDIDGAEAAGRPTYTELAQEFDVPVTQVTNFLAAARREFRGAVIEQLRAMTTTDAEFRREARTLLGVIS